MTSSLFINSLIDDNGSNDPQAVVKLVERILEAAVTTGASDVHFHPTRAGLQVRWRIDGVMQNLGMVPAAIAGNVIVRLKVLAGLLTYQTNLPQEGRIRDRARSYDIRISSFPTLFGEKVVARILSQGNSQYDRIDDLGMPHDAKCALVEALSQSTGMILIVGSAGSGKTTTAYACLREIVTKSGGQRCIVSMEDPVEAVVDEVAQSEVAESVGFNLTSGLRSLVRQDPDVIFVGEIRDPTTASIAYQAALTGQLVISTFHATDSATAVSRLLDMDVPPYIVRTATNVIVAQRLLRRLCSCAEPPLGDDNATSSENRQPRGCPQCHQIGYRGRRVATEVLHLEDSAVSAAIRAGVDAQQLRELARAHGMRTLREQSRDLVASGVTSHAELVRVFGLTGDAIA